MLAPERKNGSKTRGRSTGSIPWPSSSIERDSGIFPIDEPHDDGRSGIAVLRRVVEQVVDELAQQGGVGADDERAAASGQVEADRRGQGMRGDMGADPGRQVERDGVGQARLGVGPAEEQQRLDDLDKVPRLASDQPQDPAVFLGLPLAAEGDLDLADAGGQGRAELVRGDAGESPLPLVGDAEPRQEIVECTAQLVELVVGAVQGE